MMLALVLTLGLGPGAKATQYAAVLFGGDYPGPPSFDDNLSLSRAALANNLRTWPNWTAPGATIMELPGNTTGQQFLDAITPFTAGGATPLQKGDVFLLFYFGHGGFYGTDGLGNAANERAPAYNKWEEGLSFPGGSVVSDNMLTAEFKLFNPGVFKVFVNISCFSGGFWNGNNPGGTGDLEQVPNTLLMASSIEPLCTLTGGLLPRTFEPAYLHNLIANLARNGRPSMTFAQWHYLSWVPGTVSGLRFDDPSDPASYAMQLTVDQEEALTTDDPTESDDAAMGPQPVLSISYDATNQTATLSWPIEYLGSTLQSITNLASTNWVNLPGTTKANSMVTPVSGKAQFFRLSLASMQVADLQLTMSLSTSKSVTVGNPLAYSMTISNGGLLAATNVVLVDVLPENLTLVEAASTLGVVTNSANAIDFSLELLNPGQTATIQLTVIPTTPGAVTNSAEVVSDSFENNWTNNHATLVTTVTGILTNYTLNIQAGPNGTCNPLGAMTVAAGSRQFLAAFPTNAGYWVGAWYVDGMLAQSGSGSFVLTNIQANHTIQVTFQSSQYIIEVFQNSNGMVTPAGVQGIVFVPQGSNVSFNAFPKAGYSIGSWLLDSNVMQSGGSSYAFANAQTNHNLQVIFNAGAPPNQIQINGSSGPNGAINPEGSSIVPPGTAYSFLATPASGYYPGLWYTNNTPAQTNGANFVLTNIQASVSVYVTFTNLPSTNPPPPTIVSPPGGPPSSTIGLPTTGGGAGVGIHPTEGNVQETFGGSMPATCPCSANSGKSATAPIKVMESYNSSDADGSWTQLDAGLGYGWIHSYGQFLFSQGGQLFRYGDDGRTTKYTRQTTGTTYLPSPGYFETIVSNGPGLFMLTDKFHTVFTYASMPGTNFSVGAAVYRLIQIVDRNQNTTSLGYIGGLLATITDTYGRVTTLSNNASGHLVSMTDPLGRTTTFAYDASGTLLLSITDPQTNTVHYSYNPLRQMNQRVDQDGRLFTITYQNGKPVGISDMQAQSIFQLSNPSNWALDPAALTNDYMRVYVPSTTTKTDGVGNLWNYSYDTNAAIINMIAPDGATTMTTIDPATLRVSSSTDADHNTTSYQYDSLGNLTNVTDAMFDVTSYTYEPVFSQVTMMVDPNDRTNSYQYDNRGNRTKAIDPLGQTMSYTYDSHGNALSMTDKRGYTTTYLYDSQGNRTNMTDALGDVTSMTYDAVSNLKTKTDADGHTYTYTYDGLNRLVQQIDPELGVSTTAYDGSGDTVADTDPNGNATSYSYDYRRRAIQTVDALHYITTYAYDADDNRTNVTDANGHPMTYVYDSQNRLIRTIDALGDSTATIYDPAGNVIEHINARGFATGFVYDQLNRVIQRADPAVNSLGVPCITINTYALAGGASCCSPTIGSSLLVEQTDSEGKVTYYNYDALDRRVVEIRKQGDINDVIETNDAVTYYAYDPNNNRTFVTNPVGNVTAYQYDAINRQTNMINAAGDVTSTAYDPVGNAIQVIAPNQNVKINTYDSLNRLVQVEDNDGTNLVSRYTYDADGNRVAQFDGNLNETTNSYDALNRLTSSTDPLGRTAIYAYDPVGNKITMVDRDLNVTTYLYDAINRRVQTIDALGDTTTITYDGVNNVTALTDANGHITQYQYDGLNRRISETYPDGQPPRLYSYDGVGNILTRTNQDLRVTTYTYDDLHRLTNRAYSNGDPSDLFTYDLSGRMLTAMRGDWVDTFAYDGADRLTNAVQNGQVISSIYNIPARLRTLTYPGGRVITNRTDFRNRLSEIDDTNATAPIVNYSYDDANNVLTRSYRDSEFSIYQYNADNWTTSLSHFIGTADLIAGFGYTYDHEGNKLSENDEFNPARSETYQYDAIYRLTNYVVPSPNIQKSWNLDPLGNWNSLVSNGVTQLRTYNAANELTSLNGASLNYDPNGSLLQDNIYLYNYDTERRLTTVMLKSNLIVMAQYQYDALGRRVVKTAAPSGTNGVTLYYYDGDRSIEEQDTQNHTQATYVYGKALDELLAMTRGGVTYYCYQNALGSMVAVTSNTTATVSERYTYDAYGHAQITDGTGKIVYMNSWGTPHSAIGLPYLFTGRQLDEETGLYFYRARYFHPALGRFLQRDPMGYVDGLDLYEYVRDNPINAIDPRGLEEIKLDKNRNDISRAEFDSLIKSGRCKLPKTDDRKEVLNNGCIGITEVAQGQTGKIEWPEKFGNTKCYLQEAQAKARKCADGEGKVVFSKQGTFKGGKGVAPKPADDNSVPPESVSENSDGTFNYVTILDCDGKEWYVWANNGVREDWPAMVVTISKNPANDEHYPDKMWCATCVKK